MFASYASTWHTVILADIKFRNIKTSYSKEEGNENGRIPILYFFEM